MREKPAERIYDCVQTNTMVEQEKPGGGQVRYDNMDRRTHKKKLALCVIIAMCANMKKKSQNKKIWCKKWLRRRADLGSHVTRLCLLAGTRFPLSHMTS